MGSARVYRQCVSAGSVSGLELKTRKLITDIPVAKTIQRISISPDGRCVFTHDRESARVAVIDTASNKISDWIALPEMAYASTPTRMAAGCWSQPTVRIGIGCRWWICRR
jgi:DNA-binding beta-propeller fold protein YncE